MNSEIRGPGLLGPMARTEYRALNVGDEIRLVRERDNRADGNAIIATTRIGQPCGYIARQQAAVLAPEIDRGVPWRCRVTAKAHAMSCPQVRLYKDR